jgi:hypothetical protein
VPQPNQNQNSIPLWPDQDPHKPIKGPSIGSQEQYELYLKNKNERRKQREAQQREFEAENKAYQYYLTTKKIVGDIQELLKKDNSEHYKLYSNELWREIAENRNAVIERQYNMRKKRLGNLYTGRKNSIPTDLKKEINSIKVQDLDALAEFHDILENSYPQFLAWKKETLLPQLRRRCDDQEQIALRRQLENENLTQENQRLIQTIEQEVENKYAPEIAKCYGIGVLVNLIGYESTKQSLCRQRNQETTERVNQALDNISNSYKQMEKEQEARKAEELQQLEAHEQEAMQREQELILEIENMKKELNDESIAIAREQEQLDKELEEKRVAGILFDEHKRSKRLLRDATNTVQAYKATLALRSHYEKKKAKSQQLQKELTTLQEQEQMESDARFARLLQKIRFPVKQETRSKIDVIVKEDDRKPEDSNLEESIKQRSDTNKKLKEHISSLQKKRHEQSEQRLQELTQRILPQRSVLHKQQKRFSAQSRHFAEPTSRESKTEKSGSLHKDTSDESDPDAHKPLSFEDLSTIIYDDSSNVEQALNALYVDSIDFVITPRGQQFLEAVGLDPQECAEFTGNEEQNATHKLLMRHANQGVDFITTSGNRHARKVQELALLVFKTSYDLNKRNYPEFAQKLIEHELYNLHRLLPAIGKEIGQIILHPLEYLRRRDPSSVLLHPEVFEKYEKIIEEYLHTCKKARASKDLSFLKEYDMLNDALKNLTQKTDELVAAYREKEAQTIEGKQQEIARTAVDLFVDVGLMYLSHKIEANRINKAIQNSYQKTLKSIPYKPRNTTSQKPLQPISGEVISIGNEPLTQEIKAVIQQKKGIPQTPHRTRQKHNELADFSEVTKDFDTTSKKVAKKSSRPYKERKAELHKQLAAKKELQSRTNALGLIEKSKELTTLSHVYGKETVIEALNVLEVKSLNFFKDKDNSDMLRDMIKNVAKLNSNPEWKSLKFDKDNGVTKESITLALKAVAPQEVKIAQDTLKVLRSTQSPDSIWYKIEPTSGLHPETLIPRSFIIDVEGTKLWVNPNATKHFEELIVSTNVMDDFLGSGVPPAQQTLYAQELILAEFYNALKEGIKNGISYTSKPVKFQNWEVIFDKSRISDGFPVIKHALRITKTE